MQQQQLPPPPVKHAGISKSQPLVGNHTFSFSVEVDKNPTVVVCHKGVSWVFRLFQVMTFSWLTTLNVRRVCFLNRDEGLRWTFTVPFPFRLLGTRTEVDFHSPLSLQVAWDSIVRGHNYVFKPGFSIVCLCVCVCPVIILVLLCHQSRCLSLVHSVHPSFGALSHNGTCLVHSSVWCFYVTTMVTSRVRFPFVWFSSKQQMKKTVIYAVIGFCRCKTHRWMQFLYLGLLQPQNLLYGSQFAGHVSLPVV